MINLIMAILNLLMMGEAASEPIVVEVPRVEEIKISPIVEDYAKVGGGKNYWGDAVGKYQFEKPSKPADYIDGERPEPRPIEVVKDDGKSGTGNGEFILED